ncbi:MAG: VOC family protein [Rhodospirillales bacterium]|nr:VOC family protein [Rhodospirillales bacterium]QQS11590.1 MAG: VOC family protein [Rhodospirillales bacterium]
MITGLDHLTLVVDDIDAAVAVHETLLGRRCVWRAAADGMATARLQLGGAALVIVAPSGTGGGGDRLRARLASSGAGLAGLAFAVPDLDAATTLLARRALPASPAVDVRPTADTTAGPPALSFAGVEPAATHGVPMILVQRGDEPILSPLAAGVDEAAAMSGLDHVVIRTPNPDRAVALLGGRLGLDLRLDRANPQWGARQLFFRCGQSVVEVVHRLDRGVGDSPDSLWGLAWRVPDADAAHARLVAAGIDVDEPRAGRRPGTRVFTIRDRRAGAPALVLARV